MQILLYIVYLVNALDVVEEGGLKLHVDELSVKGWIESFAGGDLLGFMKISESLIVGIDSGERTTEPGVILGSSSIDFIWLPWKNTNFKSIRRTSFTETTRELFHKKFVINVKNQ